MWDQKKDFFSFQSRRHETNTALWNNNNKKNSKVTNGSESRIIGYSWLYIIYIPLGTLSFTFSFGLQLQRAATRGSFWSESVGPRQCGRSVVGPSGFTDHKRQTRLSTDLGWFVSTGSCAALHTRNTRDEIIRGRNPQLQERFAAAHCNTNKERDFFFVPSLETRLFFKSDI